MADATIRPYNKREDDKVVRFMVGKSHMEGLAVANRKVSRHPYSIALWGLLASALIGYMRWWPTRTTDFFNIMKSVSALAVCVLPMVFFSDWYQREEFETHTRQALEGPDITSLDQYFGRSPASGFWLLDFNKKFVGLIAIDASTDSLVEYHLPEKKAKPTPSSETQESDAKSAKRDKKDKEKKATSSSNAGTSSVAQIRHFYVEDAYRRTNVQFDLLLFATRHAFNTAKNLERIKCKASPLNSYVIVALKELGFEAVEDGKKLGIFGWQEKVYEVRRERWEEAVKAKKV